MLKIDWSQPPPYQHAGRWHKKFESIMNPGGGKITWPQCICEYVIWARSLVMPKFKALQKGPDWYKPIQSDVRSLNQQAATLTCYFPHPDDEPLVIYAFKKYFRTFRPLAIGGFRKNRVTKAGKVNISQAEKDVVTALLLELEKAVATRDVFKDVIVETKLKEAKAINFESKATPNTILPKKGLGGLLELEKKLKELNG